MYMYNKYTIMRNCENGFNDSCIDSFFEQNADRLDFLLGNAKLHKNKQLAHTNFKNTIVATPSTQTVAFYLLKKPAVYQR